MGGEIVAHAVRKTPKRTNARRKSAAARIGCADVRLSRHRWARARPIGGHAGGQEHGTRARDAMTLRRSITMFSAMIVTRRPLAALILAALFWPALRGAQAQDYPNRPIRLVVAFTAGGTTDFVARLLSERLRSLLGQTVIVDNRPGANGAIAAEYVAKSEPDGYTLFFTTVGAVAINPALHGNLPYDPVKDFAPVGMAVFNTTATLDFMGISAVLADSPTVLDIPRMPTNALQRNFAGWRVSD